MIVKVQLPLSGGTRALVYDKDRTFILMPDASEVSPRFREGETKLYFHAEVRRGLLEIGERAPAQAW